MDNVQKHNICTNEWMNVSSYVYTVFQEEMLRLGEVILSVILRKKVYIYMYMSYSEWFPR
jgi:hypothetical protein